MAVGISRKLEHPQAFRVRTRCVGNPDFGQYAPPGDDLDWMAETLDECVLAYLAWKRFYNLGSGNIAWARVTQGRKHVCSISYNGRCWPSKSPSLHDEEKCLRESTKEDHLEAEKMLKRWEEEAYG